MLPDAAYRLVAERMRPLGRTPVLRGAETGVGQEILVLPMAFGHAKPARGAGACAVRAHGALVSVCRRADDGGAGYCELEFARWSALCGQL